VIVSPSCEWSTPADVFARLSAKYGPFDLDAAATAANATCPRYYTITEDGLSQPWTGRVYCNPPYDHTLGAWVQKARQEVEAGNALIVVLLLPSRTGSAWWRDHVIGGGAEVEYLPGRLRFGAARNSAPFASVVVTFRGAEKPAPARHETRGSPAA
jgi:site-specific DNA-methyltransferase (adenine-specific)